nr:putative phosphatidylglycerol/ phosphatidylinositol transfer protein [Tanacetum cinerariifolium]
MDVRWLTFTNGWMKIERNKKNNYDIKVSGVEISPYPIQRDVETTFTIAASTETPISGGSLVIDVAYYWFGVYSETSDLCNKTSCPVTTGDFEISHSQSLPGVTPPDDDPWNPLFTSRSFH